jgi:O-antigen/teichoic acid export membrane protein
MQPIKKYKELFNRSLLLRRIGKNFSIGVAGSGLLLVLSLGNTALLTKNLPIEDYGRILVVLNFYSLAAMFFGLRVNDFIYRFFPQFKEQEEILELKGMLVLSFLISLVVGLIVGTGTFMTSSWISQIFYKDLTYVPLFRIYAVGAFFLAFEGFYISILRLHDRFLLIVICQVAGRAVPLILIGTYILYFKTLTVAFAVWMKTVGVMITVLPALIISIIYIWPVINNTSGLGLASLKKHRKHLLSNLFQTNLIGYLKMGSDTGGMFLLGVLASPTQVALYGIARQLATVLKIMQSNIQNAFTPEIVSLWAQKKIRQLYQLVNGYTKWSLIVGAIITIISIALAKPIILIFTTADYIPALPVFYVFIFTIYMTFVSLIFFPLALTMDKLGHRNLIVAIRFIYLLIALMIGLSAMTLALVQFFGVLTTRLFNDMPLLRDLRNLAKRHDSKESLT